MKPTTHERIRWIKGMPLPRLGAYIRRLRTWWKNNPASRLKRVNIELEATEVAHDIATRAILQATKDLPKIIVTEAPESYKNTSPWTDADVENHFKLKQRLHFD